MDVAPRGQPQVKDVKQAVFDMESWRALADASLKRSQALSLEASKSYDALLKKRTGWLVVLRVCSCHLLYVSVS